MCVIGLELSYVPWPLPSDTQRQMWSPVLEKDPRRQQWSMCPTETLKWSYSHGLAMTMFSILLNVWFVVFSSSSSGSSTLPDSRVNLEFSKWSNAGEFSKEKEKELEGCEITMFIPSLICFICLFVHSGSPSTSSGEKVDGSIAGLPKTCKNTEIET